MLSYALFRNQNGILPKCVALVIWILGFLSVKMAVDVFVIVIYGPNYVILPLPTVPGVILLVIFLGIFPLDLYRIGNPSFLPPCTKFMKTCITWLYYCWVWLFSSAIVGGMFLL
jgi:hypothetical protein